jgi:hypothetical protein
MPARTDLSIRQLDRRSGRRPTSNSEQFLPPCACGSGRRAAESSCREHFSSSLEVLRRTSLVSPTRVARVDRSSIRGGARLAWTAKRHLQHLPCEGRPRQPRASLASCEGGAAVRKTHLDTAGISPGGLSVLAQRRGAPYGICDRASYRSGQHHAARADSVRGHLGRVGGSASTVCPPSCDPARGASKGPSARRT